MESEDSFMESIAFFYLYMTFGDGNQVLRYKWQVAVPAEPPVDHNLGLTERSRDNQCPTKHPSVQEDWPVYTPGSQAVPGPVEVFPSYLSFLTLPRPNGPLPTRHTAQFLFQLL